MLTLFDKQIQLRMGQANVKRWVDDILPLLDESDPLGVESFATHRLPLEDAPRVRNVPEKARRSGKGFTAALIDARREPCSVTSSQTTSCRST